MAGTKQCHK